MGLINSAQDLRKKNTSTKKLASQREANSLIEIRIILLKRNCENIVLLWFVAKAITEIGRAHV